MFNIVNFKKYYNVWFNFRVGIFVKYILRNFFILETNLTFYKKPNIRIYSNLIFLSKICWIKRKKIHNYIKLFLLKNNIQYKKNIDYFLTKLVNDAV